MPAPQADVNTKFSVLNDQGQFEEYSPDKINSNVPTYFITHGLTGTAAEGQPWQKDMVESLEAQNNGANVVQVSWDAPIASTTKKFFTSGSLTNYEQAAANTQTVGQNIVDVIEESDGKIDPGTTTLIGHSLGAQVSGWAGLKAQQDSAVGKIGTIVGLDPARPSFQNTLFSQDLLPGFYKSPHRLVSSDADRVVAIHTSKRFGYTKPVYGADGNNNALDIYIRGGSAFNDVTGTKSHNYANVFFQDLLDGEGFNKDRNKRKNSIPLSELRNPEGGNPLVSLNTVLQGNGSSGNINRDIVDIKRSGNAQIPNGLRFDGTEQNDNMAGTKSQDNIFGGDGNDTITGLQQNDTLFGGTGNDLLFGGTGDDSLTGVNIDSESPGKGEIDVLTGGAGADDFSLGDENQAFYKDFPDTQIDDYAIIKGFDVDNDIIALGPEDNDYSYFDSSEFNLQDGNIAGGVGIAITQSDGTDELIGIVENATIDDVSSRTIVFTVPPQVLV